MEDSDDESYVKHVDTDEQDSDYEFDAPQFFDFTRPEFGSEIEEAERWFEVSGDYPHSPFTVKLNLEKLFHGEIVVISSKAKTSSKTKSISSNSDTDRHGVSASKKNVKGKSNVALQDNPKAKTKSADKFQPRSSTLMEPTASHLAKQHKVHDKHSGHICTRFLKISAKLEQKSLQSPPGSDAATKRQKLEIGYLRKAAHLKHQYSLLHKSTKKVTVPREPELETMLRAQRRGSKNSTVSTTSTASTAKQKQKTLQTPPSLHPKKSTPQSPEFQVFHSKTAERAHYHASAKKEQEPSTKLLESPPTEQFTELSLGSDTKNGSASQLNRNPPAKGLKKDARDSFQAEFWKCHAKPNQCGGHTRVHEAKCWSNMTRSLDIR